MLTDIRTISRTTLEEACERAEIPFDDIRTDYSGRGMSGKTCLALVLPAVWTSSLFLVELTALLAETTMNDEEPDVDEVTELARGMARRMRTDSMGRDVIVYFPGITVKD